MQFGLLGRKLGHSFSPAIHQMLGSFPYDLYEIEPDHLETFLSEGDFQGLNVTIPYKKDVMPFCTELTPVAQSVGAVNTLVRKSDGTLMGHNTDYGGFLSMLNRTGISAAGKKALVLGTGGASVTVQKVLEEQGVNVVTISRSGPDNYGNLARHRDAAILVNATPVGMYPNTGVSPVDLSAFPNLEGVLDIIYNPARTKLLLDAESRGLIAENGLWMLVAQAKESAEWFLGREIPGSRIETIYRTLRKQTENIVLIGMPGCGKSTVGSLLAQMTGKTFVDTDLRIAQLAGKSIADIFSEDGETAFRQWETMALEECGKRSGQIIATGGGAVTQPGNFALLHQNGTIWWLTRELSRLAVDGRPLSQGNALESLYTQRKPMYEAFCDQIVDNSGSPEDTARMIIEQEDLA